MKYLEDSYLVGCVDLNNCDFIEVTDNQGKKTKKEVYQAIFASQVYGTFFVIYGKFLTDKTSKAGCCFVRGVKMKLVNYKGLINMGFTKRKITTNTLSAAANGKKSKGSKNLQVTKAIKVEFEVRGFNTNYEMEIEFTKPIDVSEGTFKEIEFQKKLIALSKSFAIQPDSQDTISNALKKPLLQSIPNEPFFDTEFHERDGVDYYDNILHPGMDGYREFGKEAFTIRCITSKVNMVYYTPAAKASNKK